MISPIMWTSDPYASPKEPQSDGIGAESKRCSNYGGRFTFAVEIDSLLNLSV